MKCFFNLLVLFSLSKIYFRIKYFLRYSHKKGFGDCIKKLIRSNVFFPLLLVVEKVTLFARAVKKLKCLYSEENCTIFIYASSVVLKAVNGIANTNCIAWATEMGSREQFQMQE